jgi:cyclic beta-1,2-glucan synthetase
VNTGLPKIALLGRSPFTTIVSAAGGGFTRLGDIAVNRWRNDATTDDYGQWCYLKDVRTGRMWSAAHQPVCARADSYRALLGNDCVTISRHDGPIETVTTVAVDAEARTDMRRVVVSNHSDELVTVELTSYQEIAIAPHVSDRGHRAFSNLFVQTEWRSEQNAIIAMRRPRSAVDTPTWCGHTVAVGAGQKGSVTCETDRSLFIGRGRTARNPVAMGKSGGLSGTVGAVLDPILALRVTLEIEPGKSSEAIFTTYLAEDRADAERLAAAYCDPAQAAGLFERNSGGPEGLLSELGISEGQASGFQERAAMLLYGIGPAGRLAADPQDEPTRSDLLATGITGEWPVVFATIGSTSGIARLEELLTMHTYWRLKGIACDLVVVCGGDGENFLGQITTLAGEKNERLNRPRGVWVLRRSSLAEKQHDLLQSIARINVDCDKGSAGDPIDG